MSSSKSEISAPYAVHFFVASRPVSAIIFAFAVIVVCLLVNASRLLILPLLSIAVLCVYKGLLSLSTIDTALLHRPFVVKMTAESQPKESH